MFFCFVFQNKTANRVYLTYLYLLTIKCHKMLLNQLISRVPLLVDAYCLTALFLSNQLTKWNWCCCCHHHHPSSFVFVYFTSHLSRPIPLIVSVSLKCSNCHTNNNWRCFFSCRWGLWRFWNVFQGLSKQVTWSTETKPSKENFLGMFPK